MPSLPAMEEKRDAAEHPCDCIERFNAKLAERNTRLALSIAIEDNALKGYPTIQTEQIEKGRGKQRAVGAIPSFCPFCGTRYKTESRS